MSIRFGTAVAIGALFCLGAEVLINVNRPLIADRWISQSIDIVEKDGKKYSVDATLEMDIFSRGFLTDMQLGYNDFAVRYQFDGEQKIVGKTMGYPELAYTPKEEGKIPSVKDGFCEVTAFRSAEYDGGLIVFTEKGCPNFEVSYMFDDKLQYTAYAGDRELRVTFERNTRLNPLAKMITVWNRNNYLNDPEAFVRNEPI